MTEEKLREKIKEIEDLSARKEIREIYQSVFRQIATYQEERLYQIEQQVRESLIGMQIDYGIDQFIVTHEESKQWEDLCEVVDETQEYPRTWEQKGIQRVYLEVSYKQMKELNDKERLFHALVKTNFETYQCKVALQKSETGIQFIDTLNDIMESNGMDAPKISKGYAMRFFDVVYAIQNDRLREQEQIEEIEIDWEELAPYIKQNVVLLCNARKKQLKEKSFPIPEQNELRFKHELIPWKKDYGYIVDVSKVRDYELYRTEELLVIKTTQKKYMSWDAYEIVPRSYWERVGKVEEVLSNRVKPSVLTKLQRIRRMTKAEIYRSIMSYDMSAYFDRIEVVEGMVVFYTSQETYMSQDYMELMIKDMNELYPHLRIKGRVERQS